jgi:hypothetical protein
LQVYDSWSVSTVHRASAVDQDAASTFRPKRMFRSIPYVDAVSCRYSRIDGPSAIAFAAVHGWNGKPSVNMSESDRIPG